MLRTLNKILALAVLLVFVNACTPEAGTAINSGSNLTPTSAANISDGTTATPRATPSNKFTPADIAKLKWLEGTWRGIDGDSPFYERYTFEDSAMIVQGLNADGSPEGGPDRFELKNGEFGRGEGENRSAASAIRMNGVQFVPAPGGKGNSFRFERSGEGWDAILEWPAAGDKPAQKKVYKMMPWAPKK